jgi:hypothetical protein
MAAKQEQEIRQLLHQDTAAINSVREALAHHQHAIHQEQQRERVQHEGQRRPLLNGQQQQKEEAEDSEDDEMQLLMSLQEKEEEPQAAPNESDTLENNPSDEEHARTKNNQTLALAQRQLIASNLDPATVDAFLAHLQRRLDVACFVRSVLTTSPWQLSGDFVAYRERMLGLNTKRRPGKIQLRLQGTGDPSGCGEGISYIAEYPNSRPRRRLPTPLASPRVGDGFGPAISAEGQLMGADLRSLTMQQLGSILVSDFGMDETEVIVMQRWGRVRHVRALCGEAKNKKNKQGELGHHLDRYARKDKVSTAIRRQNFQRSVDELRSLQQEVLESLALTFPAEKQCSDEVDEDHKEDGNGSDSSDDEDLKPVNETMLMSVVKVRSPGCHTHAFLCVTHIPRITMSHMFTLPVACHAACCIHPSNRRVHPRHTGQSMQELQTSHDS